MKLKKGDIVWVRVPMNAEIIRVNQRYGYTLKLSDGSTTLYYKDDDVEKISGDYRRVFLESLKEAPHAPR